MIREAVTSSNIAAVAYDSDLRALEVEYKPKKNGEVDVWRYDDVPLDVYHDFLAAPSLGRGMIAIKAAYHGHKMATISPGGQVTMYEATL